MAVIESLSTWLLAQRPKVPPFPDTVLQLRKVMADPNHPRQAVVELLRRDPPMAAATLRVANTAFFRRGDPVTTLPAAILRIGENELSRLALAAGMASQANTAGPLLGLRRRALHESLTAAVVCEQLAKALGLPAEELFVAGLLHDVGTLVAISTLEGGEPPVPLKGLGADGWWDVVQATHQKLGLVLASRWSLPSLVAECIEQHHATELASELRKEVRVVMAADQLVTMLSDNPEVNEAQLEQIALLDTPELRQRIAQVLPEVPSLVLGLSGEVPNTVTPAPPAAKPVAVAAPRPSAPPPPAAPRPSAPPPPSSRPASSMVNPSPSVAAKLEPPAPASATAVVLPFSFKLKAGAGPQCSATAITRNSVGFSSPHLMAENFLAELQVVGAGAPFSVCVRVLKCVPQAGTFSVEAAPFALRGDLLSRWTDMVRLATSPSPPVAA